MAGDAVIFDDGGSTRIKLRLRTGVGAMDDLLDVKADVPSPGRSGSRQTLTPDDSSYGTIAITALDPTGLPLPRIIMSFGSFELRSGNQRINGDLVIDSGSGFKDLVITVHGPSANEPNVEAKQAKHKRRYVVANAPPIETVWVDGAQVFVAGTAIYTCVVIT